MATEESTPAVPAASGAPVETGAGGAASGERGVTFSTLENLETLDVSKLHPLSPEVISRQATINIGTIGHVAHGKSTIVKSISGVKTVRFKNELVRNITIKLGYANAKIYKSKAEPWKYEAHGSAHPDEYVTEDGVEMRLVRHVSFVDCPGHDILMATMLNGAAVMDAALLLIAANEPCPQPQTAEHLAATEIMQLSNIIIVQNKIDLVKPEEAAEQHSIIQDFVEGTPASGAPIIPVSAQLKYNVDMVCRAIAKKIPMPVRDFTSSPRLIVIRSFDVNKPGEQAENLKGGVAGGSILRGVLKEGDEIEIRPGMISKSGGCVPIHSRVMSLFAEKNTLKYAVPGGLIGVGTKIDPAYARSDRLVGQVLGLRGHLPPVFKELDIQFHLLRRLLGQKSEGRQKKVTKVTKRETLMLNVGSTSTAATVTAVHGDQATLSLVKPVCTELGAKVALSRKVDKHWRLIGHGSIAAGTPVALKDDLNPSRS